MTGLICKSAIYQKQKYVIGVVNLDIPTSTMWVKVFARCVGK